MTLITEIIPLDIRFRTSQGLDGSDAMNPDPDYSAAYVILKTDQSSLEGHGMTFTIGRGNEICVEAIRSLGTLVKGRTLEEFIEHPARFWKLVVGDSQFRWVGPEKGVIHLAAAALINAMWDLYAKVEGKPLWKLLSDLSPEALVNCIDFTYITDALTPDEALAILREAAVGKAAREEKLRQTGYPAYTTSAGWLGYSDDKIRKLCREMLAAGWSHFKVKVGRDLQDDLRRCAIIREMIGDKNHLMIDANQVWEVDQAITWTNQLAQFKPLWIEEPTSPDDILGHAKIARGVAPIRVATGEHCHNRVMFKQFMQAGAIHFVQIDSCRLGGVNEILAVYLMAHKFGLPVCPHAGGVGLCEYVQHLQMWDYVSVSGKTDERMVEYSAHLHDPFIDPVVIKNGHYMPPTAPGYSITMKPQFLVSSSNPVEAD